jgi:hypothetical protein
LADTFETDRKQLVLVLMTTLRGDEHEVFEVPLDSVSDVCITNAIVSDALAKQEQFALKAVSGFT